MSPCINSTYSVSLTAPYPRVRVNDKKIAQSRVVYCSANGIALAAIDDKVIRHECDNPRCLNPAHLLLGTQLDNVQDSVQRNRAIRSPGAANGRAKLTDQSVREIRASSLLGIQLATKYGVSSTVISQIKSGKLWSSV